ncbi:MAG: DNA polymerase Y family protein, partial [Pseudomonadota bacterium]
MKRVASLYLPDWPIERLAQAERIATPPERAPVDTTPLNAIAAQEQAVACSVPRGGGWRPGARWARTEDADARPRDRRAGRVSEAAPHPFKAMPPDEGGAVVRDPRATPPSASPPWKGGAGGGSADGSPSARLRADPP